MRDTALIRIYPPWLHRILLASLVLLAAGGCASKRPCDTASLVLTASSPPPTECRVDGCSMVPDFDFGHCCDRHDTRYWPGGTKAQRKQADLDFRQCIEANEHALLAGVYYYGVRVMGSPYLPTPWRWGFGWDYPRGYQE